MAKMPEARAAALEAGETYYTGAPCKHGHAGLRYANDGGKCVECVRRRCARWKGQNPNYSADDWAKNKDAYRARAAALKARDPERFRAVRAEINARRRDKRAQEARQWHARNKERAIRYRTDRLEVYATHARNRRARKVEAGGEHTHEQLADLLVKQRHRCAACGCCIRKDRHADHILPLARGGSNDIGNLQWLCPPCNLSKNAKLPHVFAQQRGRLL